MKSIDQKKKWLHCHLFILDKRKLSSVSWHLAVLWFYFFAELVGPRKMSSADVQYINWKYIEGCKLSICHILLCFFDSCLVSLYVQLVSPLRQKSHEWQHGRCTLPCKAKIQYLLTFPLRRYFLLACWLSRAVHMVIVSPYLSLWVQRVSCHFVIWRLNPFKSFYISICVILT